MLDTMGPVDALFLHAEDGVTHLHIGSCAVFAGPAPTFAEMTGLIDSKLGLLTRYRQKVRFVPGGVGHPVWVDDTNFDLGYHLRHSALPPPGEQLDLENLMGRLMSVELDRERPLWEAWMIEGLADGRWALISKVHHCMVDGIAGTDLMAVLLDSDRDASVPAVDSWNSSRGAVRCSFDGGCVDPTHSCADPRRARLVRSHHRPSAVASGGRSGSRAAFPRLTDDPPAKPVSVEGAIGPHRRWAAGRCTLDEVKSIRTALGGSVNDVLLAAVTGAFHALMIERGDHLDDDAVLRSLVPVSVRHENDHTANNQVSLVIAELPVGIADPLVRLEAVRQQMTSLKASHQATAVDAMVASTVFVPPALFEFGARATTSALRVRPQRVIGTVTTNVPGPRSALFALGREMIEYLPFVPLSDGVPIGVAMMSYNGRITFGITGDYDSAPDVAFMAARIEAEINALLEQVAK